MDTFLSFLSLFLFRAVSVRQAKPGQSCGLKGAHHGNCLFVHVVTRAADGVILPGEAPC